MSAATSALRPRAATPQDAVAIARIYNEGIDDRIATFETAHRTAEDIAAWFGTRYPVVAVTNDAAVVAFASTSLYRPRDCYVGVAEFSVYVARAERGRGAGRLAMTALIDAAAAAGFWKLVSRVFPENTASLALVRSLGFREVGVYERHGQLDGIWRDVVIVERLLVPGDGDDQPADTHSPSPFIARPHSGWNGAWYPDPATLARLPALAPGTAVTLLKRRPDGSDAARYAGTVIAPAAPWIEVEAVWSRPAVDVAGLVFTPGDTLREHFSPVHPFNVFAVSAADGTPRGWYGNVAFPAFLLDDSDPVLVWHDLILDVVVLPGGEAHLLDDDELAAAPPAFSRPPLRRAIEAARDDCLAFILALGSSS